MTQSTRDRWAGRLSRLAVVAAVLAAAIFMLASPGNGNAVMGNNTLSVPAAGALPKFLADGSPVWVVRHKDSSVSVLGAVVWGWDNLTAWCPRSSTFENWEGARFNEYGRYSGGPAGAGLVVYGFVPAGPNAVTVTRSIGRLPLGQGKFVLQTAPSCQDGPGGLGTTSHYLGGVRAASPGDVESGEFRRFNGDLVRAGNRVQLCVPSRTQCDWRLEAPGVSPNDLSYTGGPITYIGRLHPGNRVTDLIE